MYQCCSEETTLRRLSIPTHPAQSHLHGGGRSQRLTGCWWTLLGSSSSKPSQHSKSTALLPSYPRVWKSSEQDEAISPHSYFHWVRVEGAVKVAELPPPPLPDGGPMVPEHWRRAEDPNTVFSPLWFVVHSISQCVPLPTAWEMLVWRNWGGPCLSPFHY